MGHSPPKPLKPKLSWKSLSKTCHKHQESWANYGFKHEPPINHAKKSNTEKVNLNMFSVEKFMLQSTNESLEELLKLLLMKTYPNSGI